MDLLLLRMKGMDQMLDENFKVNTYEKVCYSIKNKDYESKDEKYSIVLFNQRQYYMEEGWTSWWTSYFLPKSSSKL